jgi:hypothetical protein
MGPEGGKGGVVLREPLTGNTGGDMDPANLLTKWHWIVELARKKPGEVLFSLNHVIDFEWMREAYTCWVSTASRDGDKLPCTTT